MILRRAALLWFYNKNYPSSEKCFSKWNWEVFGNLQIEITQAHANMDLVDLVLQEARNPTNMNLYIVAKQRFSSLAIFYEGMLKDKARVRW